MNFKIATVAPEGKSAGKQLCNRVARQGFQKHRKAKTAEAGAIPAGEIP